MFVNKTSYLDLFRNRKVFVIGPNFTLDDWTVNAIQESHYLIILNKSYRLSKFKELSQFGKEIILAHCMDQREDVGGGMINCSEILDVGIRKVFLPLFNYDSDSLCFRFLLHSKFRLSLIRVDESSFLSWKKQNMGFTPNTGTAVIQSLVRSDAQKIYFTGMDFFRSGYNSNYKQNLGTTRDIINYIEATGEHNPDVDFLVTRDLIGKYNFSLHPDISSFFKQEFRQIFYLKNQKVIQIIKSLT